MYNAMILVIEPYRGFCCRDFESCRIQPNYKTAFGTLVFTTLTAVVVDAQALMSFLPMSEELLSWNEFQRRFKGRWSQKELSRHFAEHKATGAMPAEDKPVLDAPEKGRPGRPKRTQQQATDPCMAPSAKAATEPAAQLRQQLLWNMFQVF